MSIRDLVCCQLAAEVHSLRVLDPSPTTSSDELDHFEFKLQVGCQFRASFDNSIHPVSVAMFDPSLSPRFTGLPVRDRLAPNLSTGGGRRRTIANLRRINLNSTQLAHCPEHFLHFCLDGENIHFLFYVVPCPSYAFTQSRLPLVVVGVVDFSFVDFSNQLKENYSLYFKLSAACVCRAGSTQAAAFPLQSAETLITVDMMAFTNLGTMREAAESAEPNLFDPISLLRPPL
ncbi:hypothetical protein C8R44DRAFT_747368 [Mycena epipterygia]|nr:hypothetical protein C8R44DRAFT_747368 [Mycena epipterygia]